MTVMINELVYEDYDPDAITVRTLNISSSESLVGDRLISRLLNIANAFLEEGEWDIFKYISHYVRDIITGHTEVVKSSIRDDRSWNLMLRTTEKEVLSGAMATAPRNPKRRYTEIVCADYDASVNGVGLIGDARKLLKETTLYKSDEDTEEGYEEHANIHYMFHRGLFPEDITEADEYNLSLGREDTINRRIINEILYANFSLVYSIQEYMLLGRPTAEEWMRGKERLIGKYLEYRDGEEDSSLKDLVFGDATRDWDVSDYFGFYHEEDKREKRKWTLSILIPVAIFGLALLAMNYL